MLVLEFSGDMYNIFGEEEHCTYFDLIVAINSLKSMSEKLACSSAAVINDSESLLQALPKDIHNNDLNFHLDGMYTFKYPSDFRQIKYKPNGKDSWALMLPTILGVDSEPFVVEAKIAFDVHMADFSMSLLAFETNPDDKLNTDGLPNHEVVALSSPLFNLRENDDETFMRHMHKTLIDPNYNEEGQ